MKNIRLLPILLLPCLPGCSPAPCDCEAPTPVATESAQPASHPLRGVVMDVLSEKSALLVKHEEVPGVMRAMTMLFKVEPATLSKLQAGDAISARMSRRQDGWALTEIEVQARPRP